MKTSPQKFIAWSRGVQGEQAGASIIILATVAFILGLSAGIYIAARQKPRVVAEAPTESNKELSKTSKTLLQQLDSPLEIRFYAILDQPVVSEQTKTFAARVGQLLEKFEDEAKGKVRVVRYDSSSNEALKSASADGLKGFNIEKGNAAFLGITLLHNEQKETITELSERWEEAIEFDLARAIERLTKPKVMHTVLGGGEAVEKITMEKVHQVLPNLQTVTLEEGKRRLQEKALNDFKAATREMEVEVKQAQQQWEAARKSQSDAEQQAAMKALRDLQAAQAERLKTIGLDLQEQISALEKMKGTGKQ